mmetsp:Transcript_21935/g.42628  ORF Transcript_21935/g.42628 Transcript_21935/m.42628 type:complete len:326 (-) Transcript_21935:317-1294(-)|eukprot:CAMPEP_0173404838 /NCGR_PEP_ID=MMETSP1356-20130122/60398_1 /TAXON_ID=77927 ORGANISM="Hemiselmis virescens, Strain PCC157" /NCGR_SAMPLE_ID=MMETSP1356 /ASSEMBLY_ACC=CAM_ASM_000847 /LENGTH=325 /DNA_ID=CAMNT_0014365571 /DNA_START=182 /DNA_END=1159 /DNA_ORIENTATION=+
MAACAAERRIDLKEHKNADAALKELRDAGGLADIDECTVEYAQHVTDESLRALSGSTRLTMLNLNACQDYTDEGLADLSRTCTSLRTLSLYWNVNIGDEGVTKITAANSSLTSLNLSGCKGLTDLGAAKVAHSCPKLTQLDLTRCPALTNPGLVELAKRCTQLVELRFYACGYIGNEGVSALLSHLHKIRLLDLCGSKEITDEALETVRGGGVKNLVKFNLGWCVKLADGSLAAIGEGCPNLQYLYLLGNTNMTTEGLKHVSRGCPKLCGLDICGLSKVDDRSNAAMKELFPNLTLLAKLGAAPYYDDESPDEQTHWHMPTSDSA